VVHLSTKEVSFRTLIPNATNKRDECCEKFFGRSKLVNVFCFSLRRSVIAMGGLGVARRGSSDPRKE
jgi:hypothetical protein